MLLSISAFFLVVSLAITRSSGRSCISKLSEYSPGLLALNDDYQTVRFRGSFGLPSPYKGPVTPEVDAKWREIEDTLTIIMQTPDIYNPSAFMAEFGISNKPTAQLIAFLLVLINRYDLMGASQDNWTVYWYSLVSRAVAMAFFWILGEPWSKLVGFEGATFAVLGIAMWFGRSKHSEGKHSS